MSDYSDVVKSQRTGAAIGGTVGALASEGLARVARVNKSGRAIMALGAGAIGAHKGAQDGRRKAVDKIVSRRRSIAAYQAHRNKTTAEGTGNTPMDKQAGVLGGLVSAASNRSRAVVSSVGAATKAKSGTFIPKGSATGATAKVVNPSLKTRATALAQKAKPFAAPVALGAVIGAAATHDSKRNTMNKQAADAVVTNGKVVRKGNVASAATKMGIVNATIEATGLGALALAGKRLGIHVPKKEMIKTIAKQTPRALLGGALVGGAYGVARKVLREARGEHSSSPSEFKKLTKKAAEAITKDGITYRKGTAGSAAKKMGLAGAILGGAAGSSLGSRGALAGAAIGGLKAATVGGLYGLARGGLRSERGEKSVTTKEFNKIKNSK